MKKILLLLPLLFAKAPAFLDFTTLPPQFSLHFANIIQCEVAPPSPAFDNELYYLETPRGTLYMKSFFKQSALIPGAPIEFKDTSVWWFVEPDPTHGGLYTARVYSMQRHEWALVAVNLGPPRRDLIRRYYEHLTVRPVAEPATTVPVRRAPDGAALQWFYTAGHNGPKGPVLPKSNQGYFAMYAAPVSGHKPPFSLVGGGAGAQHQAYGQLLYRDFNLTPNLTPGSFIPPRDFRRVVTPRVHKVEAKLLLSNCTVCHYTDPAHPTELYEPDVPAKPCPS
jgi:hypothetical protein